MENKVRGTMKLSNEMYKLFFENTDSIMFIVDPKDQNIINANKSACLYYGYTIDEIIKLKISDINVKDKNEIDREIDVSKENNKKYFYGRHKLKSGEIRDVEIYSGPFYSDNKEYLYAIIYDITDKKRLEKEITLQKSYFNQLFSSFPHGVAMLDNDYRIINVNASFEKLFGYELKEIKYKVMNSIVCPSIYIDESKIFMENIRDGSSVEVETIRKHKNGKNIEVSLLGYPIMHEGKRQGVFVIYSDISDRKEREREVKFLAYRDSLTKLYNRQYFNKKLNETIFDIKKKGKIKEKIYLLFMDLNGFKKINDNLGHHIGDRILELFSKRLKKIVRPRDIIARFGGDEFIVLLKENDDKIKVMDVVKCIIDSFKRPFVIDNQTIYMSSSIGISIYPDHGLDSNTLIKNADIAMYKAKVEKSNKAEIYSSELREEIKEQFLIESNLREALNKGELYVNYQPIIDTQSEEIIGAEALIRWDNPNLGSISPMKFIPIAEDNGLILPIGKYVLDAACRETKKWQDMGYDNLFISVNVSGKQLEDNNFAQDVKKILLFYGLKPEALELEITETIYMESSRKTDENLQSLRDLGVRLSIDDFGTGYSSLGRLKRLDINVLKIDRSFIKDVNKDINNNKIVSAIIAMAKSLNLNIVAEGVETIEHFEFLKKNTCERSQGYLFSKPIDKKEFEELLIREKIKKEIAITYK